MVKVYSALHDIYPELNDLGETKTSIGVEQDHSNQSAEKKLTIDKSNAHLFNSDLSKHIENVNKTIELTAHKDNKWVRALNKIITSFIIDYKENGGIFLFTGATANVGSSTVSYWTSRLLASFNHEEKCLYISLKSVNKSKNANIIADIHAKKYSVNQLVNNIKKDNFNHLTLELNESNLHAPATPGLIAQIIKQSKADYRWIILDSPPLFSVPGMFSLASETDGVILTVKAQSTRIPTLNAISKDLEECGAKLLGVILNKRVFPLPQFLMKFF